MRNWNSLISIIKKVLKNLDPNVDAQYQRPIGDESGSVDVFISSEVETDDATRALKGVCKDWGCVIDSETNSKDASFRLNIEGDFTKKQLRKK